MTDETKIIGISAYFTGRLHAELLMIRNDIHMGDTKNALAKVNDSIKLMEEKVSEIFGKQIENVDNQN